MVNFKETFTWWHASEKEFIEIMSLFCSFPDNRGIKREFHRFRMWALLINKSNSLKTILQSDCPLSTRICGGPSKNIDRDVSLYLYDTIKQLTYNVNSIEKMFDWDEKEIYADTGLGITPPSVYENKFIDFITESKTQDFTSLFTNWTYSHHVLPL